jgi:Spy/CpxP family protein refolding chaperone
MSKFTKVIFSSSMLVASVLALNAAALHAEPGDTPPPPHEHGNCDHRHGGPDGDRHGPGGFHGLRELNLSQDQQDKIKQIMEKHKPDAKAQFETMRSNFKALDDLAKAEPYDAKKVQALADQQAKQQAALIVERTATKHEIYAVLTPEQKQKWSELPPPHADGEKRGWGKPPKPQ